MMGLERAWFRPRQQVMPLSAAQVDSMIYCLIGSRVDGCVVVERQAGTPDGWIEVVPIRPAEPSYGIWKPTAAVFALAEDGTAGDEPVWLPCSMRRGEGPDLVR